MIAPQDLIPQWQREARKFFGRELIHMTTPVQARAVARHLAAGGEGLYITHYEALSLVGRLDEPLPEAKLHVPLAERSGQMLPTTADFCPACRAHHSDGWQQRSAHVCQTCGYVHKRRKVKTAAHYLAGAFRDGVIVVDEGTLAKGDQSLRSKALRGMRARHKYLMTGTPISNYVNDAYWLLWWTRGNATPTFPYSYQGGRAKFEDDFCVIEWRDMLGRREARKVLPQITNVSRFWRLMASTMIRRRKQHMGELPPRTIRTIAAPMGADQLALYKFWLNTGNFARYFRYAHPDTRLSDALIEQHAAGLGQLAKLEYATTLPQADPDHDWDGTSHLARSNWTPKNLKVLQVALEHVQKGEKVLIGSDPIDTGRWLAEQLKAKGVKAAHIVEHRAGKAATMSPRRRAKAINDFKTGDTQVLCCGIPSIRLGHSLETASCVIVNGLVWSYEMFDQFIARAWRLTSPGPVTVYIALTLGSIDPRRWQLLLAKSKAADLALDGQLVDEPEEPISREQFLRSAPVTPLPRPTDDRGSKAAAYGGEPVPERVSCRVLVRTRVVMVIDDGRAGEMPAGGRAETASRRPPRSGGVAADRCCGGREESPQRHARATDGDRALSGSPPLDGFRRAAAPRALHVGDHACPVARPCPSTVTRPKRFDTFQPPVVATSSPGCHRRATSSTTSVGGLHPCLLVCHACAHLFRSTVNRSPSSPHPLLQDP